MFKLLFNFRVLVLAIGLISFQSAVANQLVQSSDYVINKAGSPSTSMQEKLLQDPFYHLVRKLDVLGLWFLAAIPLIFVHLVLIRNLRKRNTKRPISALAVVGSIICGLALYVWQVTAAQLVRSTYLGEENPFDGTFTVLTIIYYPVIISIWFTIIAMVDWRLYKKYV